MQSAKQRVHYILDMLPAHCSIEDVQYHLFVAQRIEQRLAALKDAESVPQSEVEKRLSRFIQRDDDGAASR